MEEGGTQDNRAKGFAVASLTLTCLAGLLFLLAILGVEPSRVGVPPPVLWDLLGFLVSWGYLLLTPVLCVAGVLLAPKGHCWRRVSWILLALWIACIFFLVVILPGCDVKPPPPTVRERPHPFDSGIPHL